MRSKLEKEDVSVATGVCSRGPPPPRVQHACLAHSLPPSLSPPPSLTHSLFPPLFLDEHACARDVGHVRGRAHVRERARLHLWLLPPSLSPLSPSLPLSLSPSLLLPPARQVLEALLEKSVTLKVLLDTKIGMAVKAKRSIEPT